MSEYMRLKAEIEAMQKRADEVRRVEFDAEIIDIRKRILAWGITAADLFPHQPAKPRPPRAEGVAVAGAAYRHEGQEWEGSSGPRPKWLNAVLHAGGTTLEDLRIGADGKTPRERNGAAHG